MIALIPEKIVVATAEDIESWPLVGGLTPVYPYYHKIDDGKSGKRTANVASHRCKSPPPLVVPTEILVNLRLHV
jgi:hypothetical protein